MADDTVSLHRCKKCGVRMYLRDCPGHHARCVGGAFDQAAFECGPNDQHAKAGGTYKPLHVARPRSGRPKKGARREPDGEEEALDVD